MSYCARIWTRMPNPIPSLRGRIPRIVQERCVNMGFIYLCLALLAVIAGFLGWFCFELLRQNGRTLVRLEALERKLEGELAMTAQPAAVGSELAQMPEIPMGEVSRHP